MKEFYVLGELLSAMADREVRTATAYRSPTFTMRLSRVHRATGRSRSRTFCLTTGQPNFEARIFIKKAIKAHEPFPVKKIQLKFWPKKRKTK